MKPTLILTAFTSEPCCPSSSRVISDSIARRMISSSTARRVISNSIASEFLASANENTHLQIVLGVPVGVVDDDGVRGRQVDPQTPGLGTEKEDKPVRALLGIPVDSRLP